MPTEVVHSIGAAGDYTSVSAWEAAQQADFVAADEIHIGEVANEAIAESSLLFLGSTTDSTRKWLLRAASGAEHGGVPGAGARVTFSATSAALTARDFIDIEDLELIGNASSTNVILSAHPFEQVALNLNRCIVNGNGSTSSSNHGLDARNRVITDTIQATLFINLGGFAIAGFYSSPTVNIDNCAASDCNLSDDANRGGFSAAQAKFTYTNCWALDCGATNQMDFYGSGATLVNCASSDTTAHGTNPVTGIASADFANAAADDFQLSGTGSALYHAGVPVSGLTLDIAGESFDVSTPSVGIFEYITAGGPSISPNAMTHAQTLDASALTQHHIVTPAAMDHAHSLAVAVLTQHHLVSPLPMDHAHSLDASALLQHHVIPPAALDHAHNLDASTLTVAGVLSPAAMDHAQTIDAASLTQHHQLLVDSLLHAHGLDASAIVQHHVINPAALDHAQTLDASTLVLGDAIAPAAMDHAHSLDVVLISQHHQLAAASMTHAQTLDAAFLNSGQGVAFELTTIRIPGVRVLTMPGVKTLKIH